MTTADITLIQMLYLSLFLLVPGFIISFLRIPVLKKMGISVFRMTLQLFLIGLYLRFLFKWNNTYLNLLWLTIMIFVASGHVLKSSHLSKKQLLSSVFTTLLSSVGVVLLCFMAFVISPKSLFDAPYLIPIGGMLLGNCLTANIIALDTLAESVSREKSEIQAAISHGATHFEATLPFIRKAFQKAITPVITTIGTLGLVSLPGMMTGQLLGGSVPLVAIKYQIAIMVAILTVTSLSSFFNLLGMTKEIFDERGNIQEHSFIKK